MKSYCKVVPSKGVSQFLQLKKQLGREKAIDLWENVISHLDFLKDYKDTLTLDSEGVPTFESIMANPYVQNIVGLEEVKKSLLALFTTREDTRQNYLVTIGEALLFNRTNPNKDKLVAIVSKEGDKIRVKLVNRTLENQKIFLELFGVQSLNQAITDILKSVGISVGTIKEAGINGITDFSKALTLANDLIRVADNMAGEGALSEEFAHLCIEALKDHPLVQRVRATISNEEALTQILGEEYEQYKEKYDDLDTLVDEAMGHLLRNSLFDVHNVPQKSKTLWQRLVSVIKNLFSKLDSNKLRDAVYDSKTAMDTLAKELLNGDITITKELVKGIQRMDLLYLLQGQAKEAADILTNVSDLETKMAKIQNNQSAYPFIANIIEFTKDDADTALGICRYLEHTLLELESLSNQFQLAYSTDLKTKFGYLRKVHNYINMYTPTLKSLNKLLARSTVSDDLSLLSRTFNIEGIDEITIREMVNKAVGLSEELIGRYSVEATNSLVAFLKPFMGLNVVNPFIKGLKVQSVEELIAEASSDISWMDKWLSSMAESSDTLLLLFDLASKSAKDKAKMETIEISKQIQQAYNKAKNAGITDFTFMYKKVEGKRTNMYINSAAELANLSDAELSFYNSFMTLKGKLDDMLDDKQAALNHVILIRKDFSYGALELLARGKFAEVGEYFRDKVFERDYDDLLGYGIRKTLKGFDGKEYMLVPKYYLHDIENQDEVSDDPVSSLIAYAFMATNYKLMDNIVDALETGRDVLKQRKVAETRGNKKVKEVLTWAGIDVESDVQKEWEKTNIAQKLDLFFNSQVYGRYLMDEGVWTVLGKLVSKLKLASSILGMSSHIQLGFNWLANTANVANGIAMTNIEAAAGRFFKPSSLAKADGIYTKLLLDYVKELSNPIKTNKLSLIQEYFDVRQNAHDNAKVRYDKAMLTKIFGPHLAFIGQEAGDHWLYNRIAIAMLLETEAIDSNGNKSNLFEALLVEVKDGVGRLSIKEGWSVPNLHLKPNESVFTKMSRRMASVNQKLFGIYNQDDQVAAQQVAVGRLALQYRKWMVPALNKRFLASQYNATLDLWEEGYWRTFGREVLWETLKELKRGEFLLLARWGKLSPEARENCIRVITEVSLFGLVLASISLIGLAWPDKKERPWLVKFLDYQMKRQKTELGVLTPLPGMLHEGFKIINSPAAGLSAVDSALSLYEALFNPFAYFDERETGPYKGMNSVEKAIYVNTPYIKSINRATKDIDTAMQYFNK